jgi:hypothetical protein
MGTEWDSLLERKTYPGILGVQLCGLKQLGGVPSFFFNPYLELIE